MDETQSFIIVWADAEDDLPNVLVYHDLPEDDPRYLQWVHTPVRTYSREQLRSTDVIVTDATQARSMLERTTQAEPMAIPVSLARELGLFPDARYFGFDTTGDEETRV